MTHTILSDVDVQQAFLAAPPLISQNIIDLSLKYPNWYRDIYEMEEWPRGNGTIMEQLVIRGALPQVKRGFDDWKLMSNNTGCSPCDGPDCAYNMESLGGHGIDRKIMTLMSKDFRSPSYCIKTIQTTAHFEEIFAKVVEILYRQIDFTKEINIGQNVLTSLAKKYVVDSDGPKPNTANPYVYRNIGTARLSMLTMDMLEFFYEFMRRIPSCVPYDVVNGSPIFALTCSHQLLARLYRDDPGLRQDVRFSGLANDLLMKYNFMSTIRGMFIPAPVLYPRRFKIVAGDPVEIFPTVNGVPSEVGAYTDFNPDYEDSAVATHEEVILNGKYPFKIYYMPTETTLGQNTSFGPEFSFFNNWSWINPLTIEDPARRVGYFFTSATIGISQQFSEGIFSILVERPKKALAAGWLPSPICPPTDPDCANSVPAVACPCPLILSVTANPITDGDFFVQLSVPSSAVADDDILLGVDTGGFVTGTVVDVSADMYTLEVTLDVDPGTDCDHFTTIFCDNTLGCSATVQDYEIDCADNTRLDLTLSNPIKADTAADVVTIYYGDGTSASATVVSVDMTKNLWIVDMGGTAFCDQVCGVVSICVPTATDATCGACGGPTFTQCTT